MPNKHIDIPRVDFMVPGFSKCGTTTLCSLLNEHFDIYIPESKEANFFIHDSYINNWFRLFKFYKGAENQKMIGEGGTFYTGTASEEISRTNIFKHYPDIRLIFIARDPLDRIESSYREFHNSGAKFGIEIPFSIGEALKKHSNMIDDTRYWSRFDNYRRYLPKENLHILFLEDLQANQEVELKRCFEFLDVDPNIEVGMTTRRLNRGSSKFYDTHLLRKMRKTAFLGPAISKLSFEKQNTISRSLGLRKPFKSAIQWHESTLHWLFDELADDVHQFLEYAGKPINYWSKFSEAGERTAFAATGANYETRKPNL